MPYMFGNLLPGLTDEGVRVKDTFETGTRERFRPPIAKKPGLPNPARAPRESLVGARSRQNLNRTARPSSMRPGRNLGINMEGFGSTRSCPNRPRIADASFC